MDIAAPSFSLGIDLDDEDPPPAAGKQARGCTAPDPPSFSLGFDFDDDEEEEPQLPAGGREAERARVYAAAPDPPSFSLGLDLDDEEEAQHTVDGRREEQVRRYEAPDAPSFSVCIDDDEEFVPGGQCHEEVAPRAPPSTGIEEEEEEEDFVLPAHRPPTPPEANTLKRLRRGPALPHPAPTPQVRPKRVQRGPEPPHLAPKPPPPKVPKLAMPNASPVVTGKGAPDAIGSFEDEIEDFTDDEQLARDVPPSVGSCSSNSKFSLLNHGVLMSQSASKAKMSKFKQQSISSASKSLEESCTKKLLPKITISPLRKIHLLDSDTDADDDQNQNKAKKPANPLKSRQESVNKYIQKDPKLYQNSKPQGSTGAWKSEATVYENWATPALDEFCSEYFNSIKESGQPQQKESSSFSCSNVSHLFQGSSSGTVLDDNPAHNSPPAVHYFFHHDPMVRDLVRKRLQHFFPIGIESTRENEQSRAENLSYRQFGSSAAATNGWVTPSGRIPVPTDVGRRIHTGGTQSGSGHWYTGEDGKKVYVSKSGQELTGQIAYRHYKKESGRGFHKYRKKGPAKEGSPGSKRGAAKPKKKPTSTKRGASRGRRKR